MRRVTVGLCVWFLIPLAAVLLSSTPASAGGCPDAQVEAEVNGVVTCVTVTIPTDQETTPTGGGGPHQCKRKAEAIPCVKDGGVWFSSRSCYAYLLDPQPPLADPAWDGLGPSEGSLWGCLSGPAYSGSFFYFFVTDGQAGPQLLDGASMAATVRSRMPLVNADASVAPAVPRHTYIGISNWLWVPESQFQPLADSLSLGGTTVTVTATPTTVTWDVGPETVSCADAGRPWVDGMTEAATTSCEYAYESLADPAGDVHQISAQITYQVDWECSGACMAGAGSLGEVAPPTGTSTEVDVRQRQTVVVR